MRRAAGAVLIASVFAAIFVAEAVDEGVVTAVATFALAALLVGVIGLGVYLMSAGS